VFICSFGVYLKLLTKLISIYERKNCNEPKSVGSISKKDAEGIYEG
jgi:hypothetical protein